ncbi:hypothetical protein BDR06DRAFT_1003383 [Suillus hirtellus]|nr:hypothetical protein BDR06DRAFT_1003383 [Suillus hirtellus]
MANIGGPRRFLITGGTIVWSSGAPNPQGLYGLEMLNSELLLMHALIGGHETVPAAAAAQLKKALAAYMDPTTQHEIEIWGDAKLPLHRQFEPINIESDCSVTIDDLTKIAVQSAGMDVGDVRFRHMDDSHPVGVHSRNSNNEFNTKTSSWTPKIFLEAGTMKTANWIRGEMDKMLNGTDKTA